MEDRETWTATIHEVARVRHDSVTDNHNNKTAQMNKVTYIKIFNVNTVSIKTETTSVHRRKRLSKLVHYITE